MALGLMMRVARLLAARIAIGFLVVGPPLHQLLEAAIDAAAQLEEVEGGAEAGMGEQPLGPLAGTAGQTVLQQPDLAHVGGEATWDGDGLDLLIDGFVHGQQQGVLGRQRALVGKVAAAFFHHAPEQGSVEEGWGDRQLIGNPLIGIAQSQLQEAFERAVTLSGQQSGNLREQRGEQIVLAQQLVGLQRMTRLEQLEGRIRELEARLAAANRPS